jgi:Cu(I)/Ag(I) efflux system membrane fusion protein
MAMPSRTGSVAVPNLTAVELTPERIQLMGMRTAQVERRPLAPEIRSVGYVTPTETGLAKIETRFSGWVQELHVSETGERVSRGQVLATVYSPELLAAEQEFLNAKRWSEGQPASGGAKLEGDAYRRLLLLGISKEDIDEIAKGGRAAAAMKILSPVAGYVIQKSVVVGTYLTPGVELFEVADLSTVWVLGEVHEYEAGRVHLGQDVSLEVVSYPERSFNGRVQFIYPTLNPDTRTLQIRLEFKNPDLKLRPGMYGNIRVVLGTKSGLSIPTEAAVDTGEVQYVFVALPGGRFEPRRVKLGARADGAVEVLEGLSEGETVVTTANFLLDSESRLRAAIEGKAGAPAHAH